VSNACQEGKSGARNRSNSVIVGTIPHGAQRLLAPGNTNSHKFSHCFTSCYKEGLDFNNAAAANSGLVLAPGAPLLGVHATGMPGDDPGLNGAPLPLCHN
jgi:hypothetical protein